MATPITARMAGEIAKELAGRPDATAHMWEFLDTEHDGIDAIKVGLCDVQPCKSGPRKGKPNWKTATNKQERIILCSDLEAHALAWAERTGKCVLCMGEGATFVRWNINEGTTMEPCRECGGTGQHHIDEPASGPPDEDDHDRVAGLRPDSRRRQ